ncbi:MAG: DUF2798 domain-containing protein [Lachnospiraceae bacterium]|nr:DUF2798 domain-containing protein [Lachnospiraceae bacterium]
MRLPKLTKFFVLTNVWGSIIMSIVLSMMMPILNGRSLTLNGFCTGFVVSFFTSLALKLFTPLIPLSGKLADWSGAPKGTNASQLVSTLLMAACMATIMSLVMTLWGIRNAPNISEIWFSSWIRAWPYAVLIVYVMVNISLWTGNPLVRKLLGEKE